MLDISVKLIGIIWLFFFTPPEVRELIFHVNDSCQSLNEKFAIPYEDCNEVKNGIYFMLWIYVGTTIEIATLISVYISLYNLLHIQLKNAVNKDFFILLKGNSIKIHEIKQKRDIIQYNKGVYFITKPISTPNGNRIYLYNENINQPLNDLKRDIYKLNKILYFEKSNLSRLKSKKIGLLKLQDLKVRKYQLNIDLNNNTLQFIPLNRKDIGIGYEYKYSKLVKVFVNIIEPKAEDEQEDYTTKILKYTTGSISQAELKTMQGLELVVKFNYNPFYTYELLKNVYNLNKNFTNMLFGGKFPIWILLVIGGAIMAIFLMQGIFAPPAHTPAPTHTP